MRDNATETLRKNLQLVLFRIDKAVTGSDKNELDVWAFFLDRLLDDLRDSDYFGTEGQSDPRGDGREGAWSMWDVEGGGRSDE